MKFKTPTLVASLLLAPSVVFASGYKKVTSTFSDHSIRYKSWAADDAALCNGGSAHHAGWADISSRHLFFWLHEARHNPDEAPLLIWLQGGPGGSSLHGMLYEQGPCLSDGPNATKYNPHSWTENFNVVYLDNPAGVGFSYVDDDDYPSQAAESSLDSVTFIRLLYEAFPALAKVDLHLSGESYGGRWVPTLASAILEYNQFFTSLPDRPGADSVIPLRSIFVGNPWINPVVQMPSMYEVSCCEWRGQFPQHLKQSDCDNALRLVDRCASLLRGCETVSGQSPLCTLPNDLCEGQYMTIFQNATRSIYDRRLRHCAAPGNCYPDVVDPASYLNLPEIFEGQLEVLNQTGGAVTYWDMMNFSVYNRYLNSGDFNAATTPNIQQILDYSRRVQETKNGRPVDVLIYAGVTDIICNVDGLHESLRNIPWEGKTPFRTTQWVELPWKSSSGGRAGRMKGVPNLWLVEVEEAGHMVPLDQPVSSSRLVEYWLDHVYGRTKTDDGSRASAPGQIIVDDDRGVEL